MVVDSCWPAVQQVCKRNCLFIQSLRSASGRLVGQGRERRRHRVAANSPNLTSQASRARWLSTDRRRWKVLSPTARAPAAVRGWRARWTVQSWRNGIKTVCGVERTVGQQTHRFGFIDPEGDDRLVRTFELLLRVQWDAVDAGSLMLADGRGCMAAYHEDNWLSLPHRCYACGPCLSTVVIGVWCGGTFAGRGVGVSSR